MRNDLRSSCIVPPRRARQSHDAVSTCLLEVALELRYPITQFSDLIAQLHADLAHRIADRRDDVVLHRNVEVSLPPIIPPALTLDGMARGRSVRTAIIGSGRYERIGNIIIGYMLVQRGMVDGGFEHHVVHDRPNFAIFISSASTKACRSRQRSRSISLVELAFMFL